MAMSERIRTSRPRTGQFEIVFTNTRLDPQMQLNLGSVGDEEWRQAVELLLAALAAGHKGVTETNASWQDIILWLHSDERLRTFVRRSLQALDAGMFLLSLALDELADGGEDRLERLRRRV